MASALPLLLLLLLLLLVAANPKGTASLSVRYPELRVMSTPRSSLSFSLPYEECNTANIILTEGERRVIQEKYKEGRLSGYHLFVKPQAGFEGFTLTEETLDGRYYDAWFPADSDCFPPDGNWHALWVESRVITDRAASSLRLGYHIGACRNYCTKPYPLQSLRSLSIVAHGPSRWILEEPSGCFYKFLANAVYHPTFPTCSSPPPPPSEGTTDTPSPPTEAATKTSPSPFEATTDTSPSPFEATTDTSPSPFEATTDTSPSPFEATTDTSPSPFEATTDTSPSPAPSEAKTDTSLQPEASNITADPLTRSGTSSPAGVSIPVAVVIAVVVVLVVQTVVVVLVVAIRRRRLQRQFSYQATLNDGVKFASQPAAPDMASTRY